MKKNVKRKHTSLHAGMIAGTISFAVLTIFVGGIVEISRGEELGKWLWESVSYAVMYKFSYKLAASLFIGMVASFVSSMVEYGKEIDAKRRCKATAVRFKDQETPFSNDVGKIA